MAKQNTQTEVTFPADMVLETTIGRRAGDGKTLQFRLGDMPLAAVEKMLRYGAQRIFNDAVGGADTTVADKVTQAQAMIERFKAGEIGRAVRAGVDAVTAEARKLMRLAVRKSMPEVWKKFKDLPKDDQDAKLDEWLEANPDIRAQAEAEVKRRAETTVTVSGIEL